MLLFYQCFSWAIGKDTTATVLASYILMCSFPFPLCAFLKAFQLSYWVNSESRKVSLWIDLPYYFHLKLRCQLWDSRLRYIWLIGIILLPRFPLWSAKGKVESPVNNPTNNKVPFQDAGLLNWSCCTPFSTQPLKSSCWYWIPAYYNAVYQFHCVFAGLIWKTFPSIPI